MRTEDFDYNLPEKLIAQTPLEKRDASRLLVLDRETGEIQHTHFQKIVDYLKEGDVLVLNNTKVLPARLIGVKEETSAHIELLLLKEEKEDVWQCLMKPAKRISIGTMISFGDGRLKAECMSKEQEGMGQFRFFYEGIFLEVLDSLGEMPLPPYIHEKLKEKDRYQTVYAKEMGSAAAPTAGLHFTEDLLKKIQEKNVEILEVTLHVGLGTFRPVKVDDIEKHKMHSEFYHMEEEVALKLNQAKKEKRRIIAVGTTSTRVLETVMQKYGTFKNCSGWTDIFIYPGYEFKAIDGLITNFHLPKSTLLMLVSALSTRSIILKTYEEAVKMEYHFFSFGDSMFIR